ncbi:MAG: 23S rRNA (adenine(2503)-C(2))-methyltransferase RlmN [Oscillatoriophycideae cyanobacterium NC_groundwater_1537_Pr4_S-0.65um_50_18]|nr:23S rRNA (adenine(2503)-C(2))-methyltransferase RlmN [Oscillatoriophycideae cyanobacterium NC_groundwater_1537_Pr4_S-0.65um_50_18]
MSFPGSLEPSQVASVEPSPQAEPQSKPLLGRSLAELTDWVQQQGQPAYRGKQLYQWIYQQGARSIADISVFPKQWRSGFAQPEGTGAEIGRSTLHYRSAAPDGTVKFLLKLSDGQIVEAVGIPSSKTGGAREAGEWGEGEVIHHPAQIDRLTVCVSSQVGCPMACDFCATGKGGFQRNLETHEIVDQVLTVQEDFGHRVSNIVFMGMGEPLLNTDNVLAAVRSLNQDVGIGQRSITLSTVGIPGRIRRLAEQQLQVTLAISLHASNQHLREQLIPSARQYPMTELLSECRDYVKMTGRRVTFEYVLLADLNDRPIHAAELAAQLRGFQSHVNLIPYNPISEVDYQRPDSRRVQGFIQALRSHHIAATVRWSRGLEADAACGQLRASKTKGV